MRCNYAKGRVDIEEFLAYENQHMVLASQLIPMLHRKLKLLPPLEVAEFSFPYLCSQSFPARAARLAPDIDPPKVSFRLRAGQNALKAGLSDQANRKRIIFKGRKNLTIDLRCLDESQSLPNMF